MNDELFILDIEKIPENFLELSTILTTVNNTYAFNNCPFFFKIENIPILNNRRNHLKLCIYQILDDNIISDFIDAVKNITNYSSTICHKILYRNNFDLDETVDFLITYDESKIYEICEQMDVSDFNANVKVATFYSNYSYTQSIIHLMRDNSIREKFRFFIEHKNIDNLQKFTMIIHVYIDKLYLNSIYESPRIPTFLTNLIKYESFRKTTPICVKEVSDLRENNKLKKDYKREYYNYQKNNIMWMKEFENIITHGFKISTFLSSKDFYTYKINSLDEYLITDPNGNLKNPDELEQIHIFPKGGVLCDNIGLGKTSTMLGLINETLNELSEQPSLVICPARLCKQWGQEIDIISDLKYKIITTITQFLNFIKKKSRFRDFDIIIISYSFLTNINYQNFQEKSPDNPFLLNKIKWKRVIMDEAHEYISKKKMRRMSILLTKKAIEELHFDFIWLCSGTPFSDNKDFFEIIKFLSKHEHLKKLNDFDSIKHVSNKLIEYMFRKNNKSTLENVLYIPEPDISTDFLEHSEIEKAIYNSSLGNTDKMIQLCSHVLVSEEHINILGNKPLPLNVIHEKMMSYYQQKIKKTQSLISSFDEKIKKIEKSLEKINNSERDTIQTGGNVDNTKKIESNNQKIKSLREKFIIVQEKQKEYNSKLNIFEKIDINTLSQSECPICLCPFDKNMKIIFKCSHIFCSSCTTKLFIDKNEINCPCCRSKVSKDSMEIVKSGTFNNIEKMNKWGTKMSYLINYLERILKDGKSRVILFSQWDNLLKLVGNVLTENEINYLFLNGSIHVINSKIRKFKLDNNVKIVLLSSDKAVSGLNLTEANHIILLDTLNNDRETSKVIEEQAIGRAVRIGQTQTVKVKRLIMKNTIEYDFYLQNIEN